MINDPRYEKITCTSLKKNYNKSLLIKTYTFIIQYKASDKTKYRKFFNKN